MYRVNVSSVGGFYGGDELTNDEAEDAFGDKKNIDRLIRLGALVEIDASEKGQTNSVISANQPSTATSGTPSPEVAHPEPATSTPDPNKQPNETGVVNDASQPVVPNEDQPAINAGAQPEGGEATQPEAGAVSNADKNEIADAASPTPSSPGDTVLANETDGGKKKKDDK